ncbi:MAG: hypothetical protein F4213_13355 [Boseongicola sp. SB0677_bin_26]|nr:hypothetical protein [Boseongicola sp. SB0677_bin_26]
MANTPFNTMATVRLLRASGIEERQAEAITTAIKDGVTGGVATKADIGAIKADIVEIRTDITVLRNEFKWIKLIGGAILAVLVLPWLAELITATMP